MNRIAPFGLRMPPDLHAWVKEQAGKEGRSMNNYLVHLIRAHRDAKLELEQEK